MLSSFRAEYSFEFHRVLIPTLDTWTLSKLHCNFAVGGAEGPAGVGTILPFFVDAGFDPEAVTAMGEAFNLACKALHDRGQPELVREVIARQIIKGAKTGERDPKRLCAFALRAFGIERN